MLLCFMLLVFAGLTDASSIGIDRPVKIPGVLQRMYRKWTSKAKYDSKLIQSVPVQVTLLNDRSYLLTSLFPRHDNMTVLKAELWLEFPNLRHPPSRVRHAEYAVSVRHTTSTSDACHLRTSKKPLLRGRQTELGVDITALYVNCRDSDSEHQQLTLRISSEVDLTQPDAFIIVQEDEISPEYSQNRNRRSTDSRSMFIGEVIREFETKTLRSEGVLAHRSRHRDVASKKMLLHQLQEISSRFQLSPFRLTKSGGGRKLARNRQRCGLRRWFVKFEDIGWHWVIAPPRGFEAYRCEGRCQYPLSAGMNSTNHAVLQSMMNSIKGRPRKSCCVTNETASLTMLILEDNGIIAMKEYPNMVASSCACL